MFVGCNKKFDINFCVFVWIKDNEGSSSRNMRRKLFFVFVLSKKNERNFCFYKEFNCRFLVFVIG